MAVAASDFRLQLELPDFEKSADAVEKSTRDLIARGRKEIERIKKQSPSSLSFESVMDALDELHWNENTVMSRIYLLQSVSPDEELRKRAQTMMIEYQNWAIEQSYDLELYKVVKAYADQKKEKLDPVAQKYLDETLRDYRRLGLNLEEKKRERLKEIQKRLSVLETEFSTNINEHHDELEVTREELTGLDDEFVKNLKRADSGKYKVSLQYPEYNPVMEFAENEEVRRKLLIKKYNTANPSNIKIMDEIVSLRDEFAEILGYTSYNHYVIEERMAKTPEAVEDFLNQFEKRLRPRANQELEELRKLKVEQTKNSHAAINLWDYYYYASLFKKKNFEVDTKALKEFFPLDHVLKGMFGLFERLFGLRFEEEAAGSFYRWDEKVRLFSVYDSATSQKVGAFYLDLFPRRGKYGHAAAFSVIDGKYFAKSKTYQRPVSAMVCNFQEAPPSLLPHSEVETLFHEFGHILHGILTTSRFHKFSGTSVARDFVEAPSQVLENWVWDYDILQMISKHTSDPKKKIDRETVKQMDRARKAGVALFYLRQISFAKADLHLHKKGRPKQSKELMNEVLSEIFLPIPEGTAFTAGFGHLVGYASGYYGYAWADVMAADIFSIFRKKGLLDEDTGRRLRHEIYEPGSSREENTSLEAFLGRPLSQDAFFTDLGLI